ncbi:hypothetical protein [Sphingomonas jatrophae]|uniref:Exonuclease domain-containing protein n=1 Tax=Sphingomonas jatrophae TaxID=1166337 RepID=A0A1I6KY39_9SPHN|nr:hypothetical protein [Sphingomonas jatrophae]SFR96097.1 hypothetical protein SAMN05192580_1922 [Sphingomonas jatrophae]
MLTTIDFEASCLPVHGRSYPIEVGICDERGARAWLIRPAPDWAGWDWTAEAEALHGITRERLAAEGLPVARVLGELAAAVHGRRLVADSYLDARWLDTLAAAAGEPAPARIEHVEAILSRGGHGDAALIEACRIADMAVPRRHAAAADATWLFTLLESLGATTEAPLFAWAPAAMPAASALS